MSLINDALKRAQDSPPKNPPTLPPIPPAEPENHGPNWLLIGLILLLAINALVFIKLAVSHKSQKTPIALDDANRVSQVNVPTQELASATPVPEMPAATNAVESKPAIPSVKVQGIIFSQPRPWAIVSGKTVFVGDSVRDLRVTEISRNSVTFRDLDGTVTKLSVGQ